MRLFGCPHNGRHTTLSTYQAKGAISALEAAVREMEGGGGASDADEAAILAMDPTPSTAAAAADTPACRKVGVNGF